MVLIPIVVSGFFILGFSIQKYLQKEHESYSFAASIVNEVLANIRTVFTFGGEEKEYMRYSKELSKAATVNTWKSFYIGLGVGILISSIFCSAAVGFWYGTLLRISGNYDSGTVILIILAFIVASANIGVVLPEIEYFIKAKVAALNIFEILNKVPRIRYNKEGTTLNTVRGEIVFDNVCFNYPSRPELKVLNKFSLTVSPGEKDAVVGKSGSGKSTLTQLLQRFYDVTEGRILFDGIDIREFNIKWLRKQFGVVLQEPVIITGTIFENIRMGKLSATDSEIKKVAKLADADEFINKLPDMYDTLLTADAANLSGGQKQRIAIARAMLRNPAILLLDEATSALDNRSENKVQKALERAVIDRTVITTAHRLSTVRNADKIVVVENGEIKEAGTHDELLAIGGIYAKMMSTHVKNKGDSNISCVGENLGKKDMPDDDKFMSINESDNNISHDDNISISSLNSSVQNSEKINPLLRAFKLNRPEWLPLGIGLFLFLLTGSMQPTFALFYSEMFEILNMTNNTTKMKSRAALISGLFGVFALFRLLTYIFGYLALGYAGGRLTMRIRSLFFRSILRQETGWFDRAENHAGILSSRLSMEVQSLQKLTGTHLGVILETLSLITFSLIIALYSNVKLALLNLIFIPGVLFTTAFQISKYGTNESRSNAECFIIVQEAFSSIRTIVSFGLQSQIITKFLAKSNTSLRFQIKSIIVTAFANGVAISVQFFQSAIYFYVGAIMFNKKEINIVGVFRTFAVLNFAAQSLDRTIAILPDIKNAFNGIKNVFQVVDRKSLIDVNQGIIPDFEFKGNIELKNVNFFYPTRKYINVIKNFNHKINAGSKIAFTGPSGNGKSTIIQLIQRHYDVQSKNGGIYFDGHDIRTLSPKWIREQIGIVSQQPNLFNISIGQNIAYGDPNLHVSMEQIIKAAKVANIHDFIVSLPNGYDTNIGDGGSQLSGGQKQRIAIARALIRKPKILILDEATSALDTESEHIVQEALEVAIKSDVLTSIVIAHRLNTINSCDSVTVVLDGKKVESGPPDVLMKAQGIYYDLHNINQLVEDPY